LLEVIRQTWKIMIIKEEENLMNVDPTYKELVREYFRNGINSTIVIDTSM